MLYGLVAFRMNLSNLARDVTGLLVVFATLFLLYAAASWVVQRRGSHPSGSILYVVLGFAVLFRVLLLFAGLPHQKPFEALGNDLSGPEVGYSPFLIYDNDVWRYLWDGHLLSRGISPYAFTPHEAVDLADAGQRPFTSVLVEEKWWDILDNVSFQSYTTVYPPLAQGLFALAQRLAPGSVFVLKLLLVLVDLGTCAVVVALLAALGRDRALVVLYAWNPLVVKEFAGSGHVDVLMVFWLTLALLLLIKRRQLLALTAFGLSVLSKIGSLVLLVLFLRRTRPRSWPALATVLLLGILPFAGDLAKMMPGFVAYGRDWVFNSGLWATLRFAADGLGAKEQGTLWAHGLTKTLAVAGIVALPWFGGDRPRDVLRVAFVLLAGVVLLNPAVMPWYLLWPLPLAAVLGYRSWLVLTALCLLSYLHYVQGGIGGGWLWLEYGVFALVVALELRGRSRSRRIVSPS
jgi:hypothetical protein